MWAEGASEACPSDDAAVEIDALVNEVQLLEKIRAELEMQPRSATMVEADEVIEARHAELDRARRLHG